MEKLIRILLIALFYLPINSYAQDLKNDSRNKLIGTWTFVEVTNLEGAKIDSIKNLITNIWEVPKRPNLIYRNDSTVTFNYGEEKVDQGKWSIDEKKNEIQNLIYLKKPYAESIKKAIDLGYLRKDKDGNYYDLYVIKLKVLSENELIMIEGKKRNRVYRKLIE